MRNLILAIFCLLPTISLGQQVNPYPQSANSGTLSVGKGITDKNNPAAYTHSSAHAEFGKDSSNKAILIPRVVDTALVTGAKYGDVIFQIKDSTYRGYTGHHWQNLGGSAGGVTSFNGATGAVTGVSSLNGATGAVANVIQTGGNNFGATISIGSSTAQQVNMVYNGSTKMSMVNDGVQATAIYTGSSLTAATGAVNLAGTGTTINRNVNDANPALVVAQTHASATGDIAQFSAGGIVRAKVRATGLFETAAGVCNTTSSNQAIINPSTTGTQVLRNIADANPALQVSQQHASSTGNLLNLANSGGNVVTVSQAGKLTVPTFQMTTGASNGYYLTTDASGNGSWAAVSASVSGKVDRANSSVSVDIKNTGATLIFTTDPSKGRFIITRIGNWCLLNSGTAADGVYNLGWTAAAYSDIITGGIVSKNILAGQQSAPVTSSIITIPANTAVYVNVTTAATGAGLRMYFDISGYYENP